MFLAQILHETGINTRARGTDDDADKKLTEEDLDWADKIVAVDPLLLHELNAQYPEREPFPATCVMTLDDIDWSMNQKMLRSRIEDRIQAHNADVWCIEHKLGN